MDITRAFSIIFEDHDWSSKVAIAAIVTLLSALLTPVIIGLAGWAILLGYATEIIRNVRGGSRTPLPRWDDFSRLLSIGLPVLVASIVYGLPSALLTCCGWFLLQSSEGTTFVGSSVALGVTIVVAVAFLLPGSIADAGTLAESMDCVGRCLYLAIPSGLLAMVLAVRGAPWRPRMAGFGLAVGATYLGALLVHLSCPSPSPWHWLIAHALVPLFTGVAIGLFAAWVLGRLGRRSRLATSRVLDA